MEKVYQLWSIPANSVAVLSTPDRTQTLKPEADFVGCVWRTAPPGFES